MSNLRSTFVTLTLGVGVLVSGGCLVGGSSNIQREGKYVSSATLQQIEPGTTSSAWVMAVLGEPTQRLSVEGSNEIWKYAYTETKRSSAYVFLIFGGSDVKSTDSAAYFEMKDGVVLRKWQG
ncbi:MAG TPA: outer membrane protein assembly factor BamE [Tepidisphaeraceae bacterium]|jgi:outer membrane protein assembly factor BamE (lipoprotein component of BamABCDE complex)|nr:outer membrane protein assembly factor BamE [Tepidisphaeraceae bacterium]